MKQFRILFTAVALYIGAVPCNAQDSRAINFNDGWKFFKGDGKGHGQIAFDDRTWRSVTLPHDWSVEGPFEERWASATAYLPGGIGWYRKTFDVTAGDLSKITYLYFDGVYKNSEVWINNHYLGKRPNGFISFYYDLSTHLKKGKNVIAVKADHTDFADSRWYTGSGIYRNVYLLKLQSVHVGVWGQRFTTTNVSEQKADALVTVTIVSKSIRAQKVNVLVELLNTRNIVVASVNREVDVTKSADVQCQLNIDKPTLWSLEHPALYELRSTVSVGGKIFDVLKEKVGIRYFAFDPNKGFSLNGVNMKLKGVCFHDDAGALGGAVPAAVWERRLKTLKQMGCNAIRMSHNPHQDYLYDLCDRLGFLVQDEAFDEWVIGKNKWIKGWNVGKPGNDGTHTYFNEWADLDVTDMILRSKNHPSIIMWSIGNEIDYPNDPYTHEVLNTGRNPQIYGKGFQPGNPEAKQLGEIAQRLVQTAKKADMTRPITAALAGVVMSNETTYPQQLDVVGYNYQEYRYLDDHMKYPSRIIYGSENGKGFDAWQAVSENEFISGQFLWTAFDFLGEARSWPSRSSGAGLIDMAGFPKPYFYQRKAWWTKNPVVFAAASKISDRRNGERRFNPLLTHWNWQTNDSLMVIGFSNAESVELFVNGKSQGVQFQKDHADMTFRWNMVYEPGEIRIIGKNHQTIVGEYQLTTAGAAAKMKVIADRQITYTHPDSVTHVEISLVDDRGLDVSYDDREVELIVSGPGKLLGIESGSLDSHEDYRSSKRKTVGGRLVGYVKAVGVGKITIETRTNGLESSKVEITGME